MGKMALPLHYTGVLPLASGVLVAAGVAAALGRRDGSRLLRYGLLAAVLGWLLYVSAFVRLDYSLKEVFWETSPGLPAWMRIASSWAGGGGSLYLFTVLASLAGLYLLQRHRRRSFQALLGSIVLAGLAAAFLNDAFTPMQGHPASGAGLNPLLKSPWLYPHPLSTFSGYALLAVAAAAMLTGERRRCLVVYELGWALLTIGIMLGGYWSYETFGWGGYWAWDPVETSELMVWLVATVLPHLLMTLPSLSAFNSAWLLSSVFMAMYVTRTGLSPLHSFAAPSAGALVLLAAGLTPAAYAVYLAARRGGEALSEAAAVLRRRQPYTVGLLVAGLVLAAAAVYVYGTLFLPSILTAIGREVSVPQMESGIRYFHPVLYPMLVVLLAAIPLAFTGDRLGWRGYAALTASTAIVATAFGLAAYRGTYLLAPLSPLATNAMMAFGLPWALVAAASVLAYLAYKLRLGPRRLLADRLTSVSLLHLGLAVTVIGVLLSGTYAFNTKYTWYYQLKPGDSIELPGGARLVFEGYSYGISNSTVDIYTDYVGRSSTYMLAWSTINYIKSDIVRFLNLYNQGKQLVARNKTIDWLLGIARKSPLALNKTLVVKANATLKLFDLERNTTVVLAGGEPVEIILSNASININLNMNPNTGIMSVNLLLVAGNLAIVLPRKAPLEQKIGIHRFIGIEPGKPLSIAVDGVNITVSRAALLSEALLFAGQGRPLDLKGRTISGSDAALYIYGSIAAPGGGGIEVPSQLPQAVSAYIVASADPTMRRVIRLIEHSSIYSILTNTSRLEAVISSPKCLRGVHSCMGYVAAPKLVPETAWLDVKLRLDQGSSHRDVRVRIRFEAYGEVQGIHGLVSKVIPIANGLGDVYVVVSPPVVEGYIGGRAAYHELLIYYLHEAFKQLPPEKRLALAALMAAGYNIDVLRDGVVDNSERQQLEATLMDLYLLAENFNPANSTIAREGLHVEVKVIPGVRLVWLGPLVMALAAVYAAASRVAAYREGGR
ncbi:hypothetical protein CF15_02435 [Pyrodictium occultum]|uniref:Cytochrome c assembly protein domain-containing protein n=2 Tax=Pyrodictium occultum TaxID=2309 RepID=A0A0V8RUG4_PYROC|nr:hypothetical protein CF15_02435 [Pyrodictium occultum]